MDQQNILLIVIGFILLIIIGYLFYNNQKMKKQLTNPQKMGDITSLLLDDEDDDDENDAATQWFYEGEIYFMYRTSDDALNQLPRERGEDILEMDLGRKGLSIVAKVEFDGPVNIDLISCVMDDVWEQLRKDVPHKIITDQFNKKYPKAQFDNVFNNLEPDVGEMDMMAFTSKGKQYFVAPLFRRIIGPTDPDDNDCSSEVRDMYILDTSYTTRMTQETLVPQAKQKVGDLKAKFFKKIGKK